MIRKHKNPQSANLSKIFLGVCVQALCLGCDNYVFRLQWITQPLCLSPGIGDVSSSRRRVVQSVSTEVSKKEIFITTSDTTDSTVDTLLVSIAHEEHVFYDDRTRGDIDLRWWLVLILNKLFESDFIVHGIN